MIKLFHIPVETLRQTLRVTRSRNGVVSFVILSPALNAVEGGSEESLFKL